MFKLSTISLLQTTEQLWLRPIALKICPKYPGTCFSLSHFDIPRFMMPETSATGTLTVTLIDHWNNDMVFWHLVAEAVYRKSWHLKISVHKVRLSRTWAEDAYLRSATVCSATAATARCSSKDLDLDASMASFEQLRTPRVGKCGPSTANAAQDTTRSETWPRNRSLVVQHRLKQRFDRKIQLSIAQLDTTCSRNPLNSLS